MGDFDKNPTGGSAKDAAAKEKKKLIMVGVLGAVLVAVVGYHFVAGGPQAAVAGGDGNPLVPAAMTPSQALASFDPDPTLKLLQGNSALPPELAEAPHNPFKYSDDLKKQVVKPPVIVRIDPPKVIVVDPVLPPVPHPADPAVSADAFKLTAILQVGNKPYASINGDLVTVGSIVGDGKIVSITVDKVVLRHKDYPGGPLTVVPLTTKKFGDK